MNNAALRYKWLGGGDFSALATLVFDILTTMSVIAFLLTVVFGMPADIVFKRIIPGLSVGVVVGNLAYIYFAFKLAKKTGNPNITAFPHGLDAPSCIGLTLSVVGPTFLLFKSNGMSVADAAIHSWYVSCACTFFIGVIKVIFSFFALRIKNWLPTVALLGGLAGVAVGLIAFFPLLSILQLPLISFFVLAIIIMVYFAGYKMPANLPAIVVAVVLGVIVYYIFQVVLTGSAHAPNLSSIEIALPMPSLGLFTVIPTAAKYFSIAFPFALLVIFGTISVVESAQVMGDEYSVKDILLWDGIATMAMGIFGGTSQTTPYAGYPAYKKMGAKTGFLVMNIVIIGIGAWFGLINYIINFVPSEILAPVLMFVGIEISMQVFLVSEKKYYPAAIFGLFPSIAHMVQIELSSKPDLVNIDKLTGMIYSVTNGKFTDITGIITFGNGFIVTGVLWAALVYYLIDRKIVAATITCVVLAALSLFGIIHSINLDGSMYWVFNLPAAHRIIPYEIAGGYLLFAVVAVVLHALNRGKPVEISH